MGPPNTVLGGAGRMWSQPLFFWWRSLADGAAKRRARWRGTHVVTATGAFGAAAYMGLVSAALGGAGRTWSQQLRPS
eukprot:35605-Pyramimonas_sp.AAC.1